MSRSNNKLNRYRTVLSRIRAVMEGEEDMVANMANISAIIKEMFGFHWVGFYLVKGNELVLGPFQGPVACTRIKFGKGVCGSSWERKETIIVDDVDKFPGHIACSPLSKSEIVVPVVADGEVIAVLDIDSENYGEFDGEDRGFLEEISRIIVKKENNVQN